MKFYCKFINKLHISLKPFYTLIHEYILFEWTSEFDKIFTEIKTSLSLSKDTELPTPNTTNLFYITVDAYLIGRDATLFQNNTDIEIEVISFNSRISTIQAKNFLLMIKNSVLLLSFFPNMNLKSLALNSQSLLLQIKILIFFHLLAKEISHQDNINV